MKDWEAKMKNWSALEKFMNPKKKRFPSKSSKE